MNHQPKRKEYKNAIYKFGHGFIYRLMRPWYRIPLVYNLSNFSKEINESLEILHSFSTGIINDRKKTFEGNVKIRTEKKKRMALLDLLLKNKHETGAIDDEGIREEVDTFMFEVRLKYYLHLVFKTLLSARKCDIFLCQIRFIY